MKNFLKQVLFLLGMAVFLLPSVTFAVTHTLQFVQTPTITLYSSLSSAGTSMRVTPYPKDLDGTKLTMSSFGSTPTLTVDPKVKNYEEIIGFTGITDNGDNTATITGLSRDLISQYPYTTTGTGKAHTAGSIVVFSNNPQMYARFAAFENDGTVTGLWTYTTSPIVPTPTTAFQAATKGYVDGVAVAGAPAASFTVPGITVLASGLNAASSTASTTYNALPYGNALSASYATSSPGNQCGLCVPVSQNNGKLNQSWFDLTAAYSWTGLHTFSAGFLATASSTFTATTSIQASNVNSNALKLNGVPYAFPSSGIASSTYWGFDVNGKATYEPMQTYAAGQFSTTTAGIGPIVVTHSMGFLPKHIHMFAECKGGANSSGSFSEGDYINSTGANTVTYNYLTSAGATTNAADGSNIVHTLENGSDAVVAAISAVTTSTFTLNVTTNTGCGSPGTFFQWNAEL